jgi:hypothetical protein
LGQSQKKIKKKSNIYKGVIYMAYQSKHTGADIDAGIDINTT